MTNGDVRAFRGVLTGMGLGIIIWIALMVLAIWAWAGETTSASAPPSAQATAPAPPAEPAPITVSEADSLAWERYQLLQKLADFQMQALRLQNEKTLTEEYAKLNQRFLRNYKLPVDAIERRGEQWIPRSPVTPPASK